MFFNVLITDVLMLFPGRLGETLTLSTSFFFFSLDNGSIALGINGPGWISNAVADQPRATTECSSSYSFLAEYFFVIPTYGDKTGGPTSFSG